MRMEGRVVTRPRDATPLRGVTGMGFITMKPVQESDEERYRFASSVVTAILSMGRSSFVVSQT